MFVKFASVTVEICHLFARKCHIQTPQMLYLASRSPRRRELLTDAGYTFKTVFPPSEYEEPIRDSETPHDYVQRLASDKAWAVALLTDMLSTWTADDIILGCDTIVCADNFGSTEILGKPADRDDARRMLSMLSNTTHRVISGIALVKPCNKTIITTADTTTLRMRHLTAAELDGYIESGLWQGKAGAFGLQDKNDWLEVVEGSYTNIVGLPMEKIKTLLKQWML
ncbi:MAG: Maf family protein [Planctomycetaceae bacterium]|jgi:septum formation protein|nr:Maf family protein [Planctomycetaceae bacterium]